MAVAVTGGTGFLGLHLVRGLMRRHDRVLLLGHAGSRPALDRLRAFLRACGDDAAVGERVTAVDVDVSRPHLGLPEPRFRALAGEVAEVWHCAGLVDLQGSPGRLSAVNVEGTRRVLELAGAAGARLCHVSTAFVAGARRDGTAGDDDLDAGAGFENAYEASKHEAERAVREWAATHRAPVLVFRPSVLVTDLPPSADLPEHTVLALRRLLEWVLRRRPSAEPVVVRVPGDPGARLNMLDVHDAASAMLAVAEGAGRSGGAWHVVHPRDVRLTALAAAFEAVLPVRFRVVPGEPEFPTDEERVLYRLARGFLPYHFHRRAYAGDRLREAGVDTGAWTAIDRDYLVAGLTELTPAGVAG